MLFGETAQCGEIEMIVMVVRHEHDIDGGQFLKANARVAVPLGACPGNRAASFRPDGIGEDVETVHLDEKRRMTDGDHGKVAFRNADRGRWPGRNLFDLGPFGPVVAEQIP